MAKDFSLKNQHKLRLYLAKIKTEAATKKEETGAKVKAKSDN